MAPERSRSWVFTLNNYTADDESRVVALASQYLVYGREVGDSGTPHLQGYVYVVNPVRLTTLHTAVPRAHWAVAKGTPKQASDYCKKGGDVYERGDLPQHGKRSDLQDVIDACKSGVSKTVLIEEHTSVYARYPRFVEMCREHYALPRDPNVPPVVKCYWGHAGSGKTRTAFEEFGGDCFMKKPTTLHWFDGYEGHSNVIIDEADKGFMKLGDMLDILDRYPCKVKVHGGVREFVATTIVCTANKHPADWYPNCSQEERLGLLRRFTEIKMFTISTTCTNASEQLDDLLDA